MAEYLDAVNEYDDAREAVRFESQGLEGAELALIAAMEPTFGEVQVHSGTVVVKSPGQPTFRIDREGLIGIESRHEHVTMEQFTKDLLWIDHAVKMLTIPDNDIDNGVVHWLRVKMLSARQSYNTAVRKERNLAENAWFAERKFFKTIGSKGNRFVDLRYHGADRPLTIVATNKSGITFEYEAANARVVKREMSWREYYQAVQQFEKTAIGYMKRGFARMVVV